MRSLMHSFLATAAMATLLGHVAASDHAASDACMDAHCKDVNFKMSDPSVACMNLHGPCITDKEQACRQDQACLHKAQNNPEQLGLQFITECCAGKCVDKLQDSIDCAYDNKCAGADDPDNPVDQPADIARVFGCANALWEPVLTHTILKLHTSTASRLRQKSYHSGFSLTIINCQTYTVAHCESCRCDDPARFRHWAAVIVVLVVLLLGGGGAVGFMVTQKVGPFAPKTTGTCEPSLLSDPSNQRVQELVEVPRTLSVIFCGVWLIVQHLRNALVVACSNLPRPTGRVKWLARTV
eukprot:SAG11_NODE_6643_length_1274_cov_2.666383_1_plen_296_part_00